MIREKIASIIIDELEGRGSGKSSMVTEILSLITTGIEKVENPFFPDGDAEIAFEECRQRILNLLKESK